MHSMHQVIGDKAWILLKSQRNFDTNLVRAYFNFAYTSLEASAKVGRCRSDKCMCITHKSRAYVSACVWGRVNFAVCVAGARLPNRRPYLWAEQYAFTASQQIHSYGGREEKNKA